MRIDVTQEDINQGQRRRSDCCPVALALGRLGFPCHVTLVSVYLAGHGRFRLPSEAQLFILNYDEGMFGLRPFSFDLSLETT